ncbi:hypothetical protein ACU6RQ_09015 [Zobellella denitrificans]
MEPYDHNMDTVQNVDSHESTQQAGLSRLRVPYGLKEGRLYGPGETARGKECGCVCPGCQRPLVANQGKKKRAYFSHYQVVDCIGGYESAVHLMAKQVIRDHLTVLAPAFGKTLTQLLASSEGMQRYVEKEPEWLRFNKVQLEVSAEGSRPDIVGWLTDDTPVYIEVFVTHAVPDDKKERFSEKNMFELDLSHLSQDSIADLEIFTKEVLELAPRHWIGCQLYKLWLNNEEQKFSDYINTYREEHMALRQHQKQIVKEREKQHRLELARKQQISQKREQNRDNYKDLLERLYAMNQHGGDVRRDADLYQKAERWKPALMKRYHLISWPDCLDFKVKGDWIFNVHRSVWQAYIYQELISKKMPRSLLHTHIATRKVIDKFGILDWALRLIELKKHYKKQGKERGQWYGGRGAWFFDDDENRMIPTPYFVIMKYLESLAFIGILKKIDRNFIIACNSIPDYLEQRERRQDLFQKQQEKAEQLEVQREQDRAELRAVIKERTEENIKIIVTKVTAMKQSGLEKLLYCQKCCNFQSLSQPIPCSVCGHHPLLEVTLTEEYLATLHHRLRCSPGIYYSGHN